MSNLAVALRHAEAGVFVFPVPSDRNEKWRVAWSKQSTTAEGSIKFWWHKWPDDLVGIDLRKSGLLVLDGDQHPDEDGVIENDGVEALRNLFADHAYSLRHHPVTRTPRNGVHVFFSNPDNSIGNPKKVMPKGVDVKGAGGLIIAPGTIRHDGVYRALPGHPSLLDVAPPEPPHWLLDKLRPPRPVFEKPAYAPFVGRTGGKREERYALAALQGKAGDLAAMAPETGRNDALNDHAWWMGRMVARGWIDRGTVEHELSAAAMACDCPGWRQTLSSGLNSGLQNPHHDLKDRR
jgi:hypothetical protein